MGAGQVAELLSQLEAVVDILGGDKVLCSLYATVKVSDLSKGIAKTYLNIRTYLWS